MTILQVTCAGIAVHPIPALGGFLIGIGLVGIFICVHIIIETNNINKE